MIKVLCFSLRFVGLAFFFLAFLGLDCFVGGMGLLYGLVTLADVCAGVLCIYFAGEAENDY